MRRALSTRLPCFARPTPPAPSPSFQHTLRLYSTGTTTTTPPTTPPSPPRSATRVRLEVLAGGIRRVVLCNGAKLNVMDEKFFEELHGCFRAVDEDETARVVILSAEGKHFTAGLDLKAAAGMFLEGQSVVSKAMLAGAAAIGMNPGSAVSEKGMPAMRQQKLHKTILRWQDAVSSLQRCRVPTIAAVHGKCIGGGVDVVTSADIRLTTRDATFSIKETEVGIVADLGTLQRINHIIGQGLVRELAFTGVDLKADRGERIGFVNKIYETNEDLDSGAMKMAQRIASLSPLAVQGTKEVINFPLTPEVDLGLRNVALHNSSFLKSDDLLTAVVAFMKKHPAEFTDYVLPKDTTKRL